MREILSSSDLSITDVLVEIIKTGSSEDKSKLS